MKLPPIWAESALFAKSDRTNKIPPTAAEITAPYPRIAKTRSQVELEYLKESARIVTEIAINSA